MPVTFPTQLTSTAHLASEVVLITASTMSVVLLVNSVTHGTAHNHLLTPTSSPLLMARRMVSSAQALLKIKWPTSLLVADLKLINKPVPNAETTWSIFQPRDSKRNRLRTWLSTALAHTESIQPVDIPLSRSSSTTTLTLVSSISLTQPKLALLLTRISAAPGTLLSPPHGKDHSAHTRTMVWKASSPLVMLTLRSLTTNSSTARVPIETSGSLSPVLQSPRPNQMNSWPPDNSKPSTTTSSSVSKSSKVVRHSPRLWSLSQLPWSQPSASSCSDDDDQKHQNYKREVKPWTKNWV